ncbi:MAG: hypothetical protein IKQ60_01435 [Candidatus Methanomethylophilaceae archaeon]|nr:hypothetical protein [Candidatus Methanomethylophilaceae archaeon]
MRGISSVVDSIKRIRISSGSPSGRDLGNEEDYEVIESGGVKIFVAPGIDEAYCCNTKYEPQIPNVTKSETSVDNNGNKFVPVPVAGEDYDPAEEPSSSEHSGPLKDLGEGYGTAGGFSGTGAQTNLEEVAADGIDVDDVMIDTGFDCFGMGTTEVKDSEPVEVKKAPVTVTKASSPSRKTGVSAIYAGEALTAGRTARPTAGQSIKGIGASEPGVPNWDETVVKKLPKAIVPDEPSDDELEQVIPMERAIVVVPEAVHAELYDVPERGIVMELTNGKDVVISRAIADIARDADAAPQQAMADDVAVAKPEPIVTARIDNAAVVESLTKPSAVDIPEGALDALPADEDVPAVGGAVPPGIGMMGAAGSKTVTGDMTATVSMPKGLPTSESKRKPVLLDDSYSSISNPTVSRPLRFTGGNLVSVPVEPAPKRKPLQKKRDVPGYTVTKEAEEGKKEAGPSLNSIMANSVKSSAKVVPRVRRFVLEPIQIVDEVEGVMRLTIPDLIDDDPVEEDVEAIPADGIEESVYASIKDECQVVFLFGGDGYGDDGVFFNFGR